MRTIAIGDVHGCLRALDTLLSVVRPTPADRIVTLGDYVDRGPDSAGVLDRLIALHDAGNLVALRGNHDQIMIEARSRYDAFEQWLGYGGRATLDSYARRRRKSVVPFGRPQIDALDDVPESHWHFLEDVCMDWYETATHVFVHANLEPGLALDEQPLYVLHYEKFNRPAPHCSGKVMVCGHTSQKNGLPISVGHAICIDTWACGTGWLTALDVGSGKVWQANQAGETRSAWIDDYEEASTTDED